MTNIYFMVKQIFKVFGVAILFGALYIIYDLIRQRRTSTHTIKSALYQYIGFNVFNLIGIKMKKKLEQETKKCKEVQEKILFERISRDKDTVYGKMHNFASIKSVLEFKVQHPLVRYDKVKPYVNRIMEGEENILIAERPSILAITSGTSGRPTIIPMIKKQSSMFLLEGVTICMNRMFDAYPHSKQLQKSLKIFYTPKARTSPAGIPVGPNSSSPKNSGGMLEMYTTPLPAYDIMKEEELLYIHLLFALCDRNLGTIEANFASLIHSVFVAMELQWQQLTKDIQTGRINPSLDIPDSIRESVQKHLKPDPDRADELRSQFSQGFKGVAKRLWPHLNVILATDTGAFDLYGRKLKAYYTYGIPIYSPLYAASEGLIGINMWPQDEDRYYMLVPNSMFYEFIPIQDSGQTQPETLLIDEVEEGSTYELVITNISGLYRYRFGDVVKVIRFHNQCPVVEFICRQGQLLNVRGEKTYEDLLYNVLLNTVNSWPSTQLVDYTTMESVMLEGKVERKSPFYVLFLELSTNCEISEAKKKMLDENLCEKSFVYNSFREKGSISQMQVHVVKSGSFRRLKAYLLANTSVSANQFKVPRVLRNEEAVAFMMEQII
ncbi:GH3 domain-containing protein-like [Anneissia japonica]|uniref:GH3 domain-containing protein-like n=1 Tax=Anneissia japonica TaxID=1529436 RepID=UPI0014258C87|nr:GH3 domain-containing protein-like [Anneissia japonica]